jgi:hypothetical protein
LITRIVRDPGYFILFRSRPSQDILRFALPRHFQLASGAKIALSISKSLCAFTTGALGGVFCFEDRAFAELIDI